MNRREAVQSITLLLGGTIVGSSAFLTGCKTSTSATLDFTTDDIAYLNEVGETILPTTASSPGAKAANVGAFMTVMVKDTYTDEQQKTFKEGMKKLNDEADKAYSNKFMKLNEKQKHDLLVKLDAEQKAYQKDKKKEDPSHYFRLMKELTMLGFFTSEIGSKQARRYVETPGRYDGCLPYAKGDKAFA